MMEIFFILLILVFVLYEHNSRRAKKRILQEKLESERNWIRGLIVGAAIDAGQWPDVVERTRQATEWLLFAPRFSETELRDRFKDTGLRAQFSMLINALHTTPEALRERLMAGLITGHEAGLLIAEQVRQLRAGERMLNEEEVALIAKVHTDFRNDEARRILQQAIEKLEAGEISQDYFDEVFNVLVDNGHLKPDA